MRVDRRHREFAWLWVWLTLVLSVAVGAGVTVLLWGGTRAEHRDAFDTGWKSAAAVLAILAAVVTVERLRLGQREHHRQLAADRAAQITDLSAKASEQLGSEKAAVRIGGLTDLERLAQTHPDLRQTVVDRICAYLRAPYQPPPDQVPDDRGASHASDEEVAARRLELDVRRTAQQILQRHLYWNEDVPETFWENISLDLRDAVLVEFALPGGRVTSADFRKAKFHGGSSFGFMSIAEDARFSGASFFGTTWFGNATFAGNVEFNKASFAGMAWFAETSFAGHTWFSEASFAGETWFTDASFTGFTSFAEVSFAGIALFGEASFAEESKFAGASFAKEARFDGTSFAEAADFDNATFAGIVEFDKTFFESEASFTGTSVADVGAVQLLPAGWVVQPEPNASDGRGWIVRDRPERSGDPDEVSL